MVQHGLEIKFLQAVLPGQATSIPPGPPWTMMRPSTMTPMRRHTSWARVRIWVANRTAVPRPATSLEVLLEFFPHQRVDGDQRLVEQQQLRFHGQGLGDEQFLPRAGRVILHQLGAVLLELEILEKEIDLFPAPGIRDLVQVGVRNSGALRRSACCTGTAGREHRRSRVSARGARGGRPGRRRRRCPPSGASSPARIFSVVVLPAPFGPSRP